MRRPSCSFLVALLLHLSLSSLIDARALSSPGVANNNVPTDEILYEDTELADEETSMGSFSQLPLQWQQQPPSAPSPCAEPPFALPSSPSQQLSPPTLSGIPASDPPPIPSPPISQPGPITQIPNPPDSPLGPPTQIPIPPISPLGPPTQIPNPPSSQLGPPIQIPSPPNSQLSPPTPTQIPSPPNSQLGPPTQTPTSPPTHNPSVPIVAPSPPSPPSQTKPGSNVWCVAKPSVSDSTLQRGLDYACGMGADCKMIQPSAPCFQPNTVSAHSSFAFNSYWQKAKAAGGTCDFGGTAMLVSIDPSYSGCHFVSS
ncbi:unnamed protein product [Linum trigynum]|uniref:X8 domain-containing protein n=1 Tax=Linum trigynum TaxID=586398 RepID=A0AAV2EJI1_9ROSI